jgi:PPOX class probable FMN-dependent enzyme
MALGTDHVVSSREALRQLYSEAKQFVREKERPAIDLATRAFIERSPFVLVATVGADGSVDVSPRGGPSGFVRVLDDAHLAICDLAGNNRLDTLENVLETGQIGLLFVMPGQGETVRLNGTAVISTDPEVLNGFTTELKPPKAAILVTVETTFVHCAKAMRRSRIWDPAAWTELADAPDGSAILACQQPGVIDADAVRSSLAEGYSTALLAERADAPA